MENPMEQKPDYCLTISQMAKLRNININSLRYYEKLGILKPAYTDPQSKYRYYTLEQLHMLDIILLCISLDIPLKQLSQFTYLDSVKLKELLEEGRQIAEQRHHETIIGLKKIEYLLNFLEKEKNLPQTGSVYTRVIEPRLLLAEEYHGDIRDIARIQRASARLFTEAPEHLHPTFMSGIMLRFTKSEVRQYIFFELLSEDAYHNEENIVRIPQASFRCLQVAMEKSICDYYQLIREQIGEITNGTAIISNVVQNSMQVETSYREIQVMKP